MKITHYITLDKGSGPVSLIEVQLPEETKMVRITHNSRFGRLVEVDAAQARHAVEAASDLGSATTKVNPEHAHLLADEVLRWCTQHGCTSQGLKWGEDGGAILFRTQAEADLWEQDRDRKAPQQAPKRRRIIG